MSCKKVPNPCKICLQTVKKKTGLQCQGACEAWVHYECLNYTPGKIKDIQNGQIRIICPCPDCKTTVPKELRSDEPFSCNNIMCPANNPPSCLNAACQANEATNSRPQPSPPPGTLTTCGTDCRSFGQAGAYPSQISDPCMEGFIVSGSPEVPYPIKKLRGEPNDLMPSLSTVEEMYHTVGELTNQINEMLNIMRGAGKRDMERVGGGGGGGGGGVGGGGAAGYRAGGGRVVGDGQRGGHDCGKQDCPNHRGPKALCPKPCHCPGNPQR